MAAALVKPGSDIDSLSLLSEAPASAGGLGSVCVPDGITEASVAGGMLPAAGTAVHHEPGAVGVVAGVSLLPSGNSALAGVAATIWAMVSVSTSRRVIRLLMTMVSAWLI